MLWALFFSLLNFSWVEGRATSYWPAEGSKTLATGQRFLDSHTHIAHRRLPLGTRGLLCSRRTGRCVSTVVGDRGPWNTLRPCSKGLDTLGLFALRSGPCWKRPRRIRWLRQCYWLQTQVPRRRSGWYYRGEFDVTRPVARALKHRSFDKLVFLYWR